VKNKFWRQRSAKALAVATGLAIAFAAQLANAECGSNSCENARILELYTEANGNVYVQLSGTTSNLNCTLASNTFVTLLPGRARFAQIYASLLAAQLSDRLVTVRIDNGSAGCTIAYIYTLAS